MLKWSSFLLLTAAFIACGGAPAAPEVPEEPAVEEPAVEEPAMDEPAVEEPAMDDAAPEEPATE